MRISFWRGKHGKNSNFPHLYPRVRTTYGQFQPHLDAPRTLNCTSLTGQSALEKPLLALFRHHILAATLWSLWKWDMEVSQKRGTPKWFVYIGKSYKNGWFGGTPISGNPHIVQPTEGYHNPNKVCVCVWTMSFLVIVIRKKSHQIPKKFPRMSHNFKSGFINPKRLFN